MKGLKHSLKKCAALLLIVTMLFSFTGCSRDIVDFDAVFYYVELWLLVNGYIDPVTEEIRPGAIAKDLTSRQNDDPVVNMASEVRDIKNEIEAADNLAESGFQNGDVDKIHEAIDRRPGEYYYQAMAGVTEYYGNENARIGNLQDEFDSYLLPDQLFPDHMSARHMVDYPSILDEGARTAADRSVEDQLRYLDQVESLAKQKLLRDLEMTMTHSPTFEQEIYEIEYVTRYYYLERKVAEDRHRILGTEESKRQLDESVNNHNQKVRRLTDELREYTLLRSNPIN